MSDWPIEQWSDRRLLLGVSGGADSIALLLALHELAQPQQLTVAHFNHQWRGQESDDDQTFVVKLCQRLERPCMTGLLQNRDTESPTHFDDKACGKNAMLSKANLRGLESGHSLENVDIANDEQLEEGDSTYCNEPGSHARHNPRTEEMARRARYNFLKQSAYEIGASYVVTAHNADDRIETVLHNLLRGTGLVGAASLVMFRSFDEDLVLARPLLRKRRKDIERFLGARGQSYREDSSNRQLHYRRNFLRHQVLPLLATEYPAADRSLLNFSELVEEHLALVTELSQHWLADIARALANPPPAHRGLLANWPAPQFFVTPIQLIANQTWSVAQMGLRQVWLQRGWPQVDLTRSHWSSLDALRKQSSGSLNLPGNLRAEVVDGYMAIGPVTSLLDRGPRAR